MRPYKYSKMVIVGIFLGLLIGTVLVGGLAPSNNGFIVESKTSSLQSLGSTNPSNPTLLSEGVLLYEYYGTSGASYYYKTSSSASSSYYHIFWLQPKNASNYLDLYLYSNSGYSNEIHMCSSGDLDWIVYRPSSSQYLYLRGYTSGAGYAYLKWEKGNNTLTIGSIYSGFLNISECLDIYIVYLSSSLSYTFNLDVPSGGDFELYLYYLSYGGSACHADYTSDSANYGIGVNETIAAYSPLYTNYYAIIVKRSSGSGVYYLSSSSSNVRGLSDDSPLYQSYTSGSNYSYQTGTASSSYYHVVWVKATNSYNNINLSLYADSGYSNLLVSSLRGSGYLNWLVFRPSSSQYYYPKVVSYYSGDAYIEWEDSSNYLSIGSSQSCYLSNYDFIDMFRVYLSSSTTYSFTLDVPATADYDLYLYHLLPGNATTSSNFVRNSTTLGQGYDEIISSYTPISSDYYAIIITWKSGSGSVRLYASLSNIHLLLDFKNSYSYYSSSASYYYQTGYADYGDYYVVWLQPTNVTNYFGLYLYSDSGYSTNVASSARGYGNLDWIIYRPSYSGSYYPKVYGYSGTGYAYIEWKAANYLSSYSSVSCALLPSECLQLYVMYLYSSRTYDFNLDVPSSGDFDLYLYYLDVGSGTNYSGFSLCSANSGAGNDEAITNFCPLISGYYAIIVARSSGSGTFTLKADTVHKQNPSTIMVLVVFGILATLGISLGVYKNYNQRTPTTRQPQGPIQASTQAIGPVTYKSESQKYVQRWSKFAICTYCQSKNEMNELFCRTCGSEL